MKRFLVFIVILIVTVSLGFTTYAFLKNNEQITLLQANFYVNNGEEFEVNFDVVNKKRQTKYTYAIENAEGLQATDKDNVFKAIKGGEYSFNIATTNKNYKTFSVSVVVGDGTESYPYFISSKEELLSIGSAERPLSSHYKLISDIDLTGENFAGLGALTGSFNGNNCTISNACFDAANSQTAVTTMGLFTSIGTNSTVENLSLKNFSFTGSFSAAAIVSATNAGTVRNINIISSQITNTASNGKTAGVVCVNQSSGENSARIDRVASDVTISARNSIAGICVNNRGGVVINSYSKGALNSSNLSTYAAGLITFNESYGDFDCFVKDCYSISPISTNCVGKASLIFRNTNGYNRENIIMGCYYAADLTLCDVGVTDIESKEYNYSKVSGEELKDLNNLVSFINVNNSLVKWNNTLWVVGSENNGYPHLDFLSAAVADQFESSVVNGEITTAESLINLFSQQTSSTDKFVIVEDIDLSSYADFTPLGLTSTNCFVFNGTLEAGWNAQEERYYKISNLTITSNHLNNALIFETGKTAQILNLVLENVSISCGSNIGSIVGVNNGLISNCSVTSDESALGGGSEIIKNLGGICGVNNGAISNCTVNNKISALTYAETVNVGGVAGENKGVIHNVSCSSEIAVTGTDNIHIGGITGSTNSTVNYSIFTGSIIADMNAINYAGGITGYASSYAKISKCQFAGSIEACYVGGVVAYSQKSEITETYVSGSLKGSSVGGVAYTAPEIIINNVSAVCNVEGKEPTSLCAGIAVELFENQNSYCGPIFLAVSFITENNYVTSYHCTNIAWPWEWNPTGIPTDNLVFDMDTMINAERWVLFNNSFLPVDEDGATPFDKCIGYDTGTIFTDRGFKTSIWAFNMDEYPTLINCKNEE